MDRICPRVMTNAANGFTKLPPGSIKYGKEGFAVGKDGDEHAYLTLEVNEVGWNHLLKLATLRVGLGRWKMFHRSIPLFKRGAFPLRQKSDQGTVTPVVAAAEEKMDQDTVTPVVAATEEKMEAEADATSVGSADVVIEKVAHVDDDMGVVGEEGGISPLTDQEKAEASASPSEKSRR